jgi:hypothetical protein
MEPEGSLSCSQEPATCPYPQQDESILDGIVTGHECYTHADGHFCCQNFSMSLALAV